MSRKQQVLYQKRYLSDTLCIRIYLSRDAFSLQFFLLLFHSYTLAYLYEIV